MVDVLPRRWARRYCALPLSGELRPIICFDLAAIAYLGLFLVLMSVATQEQAAEHNAVLQEARYYCGSDLVAGVASSLVGEV